MTKSEPHSNPQDETSHSEAELAVAIAQAMRAGEAAEQEAIEATEEVATQQRIAELEAENAALRDKALRAVADAENTRRRAEREQRDASRFAVTNFARDLISVYENLNRATASISEEARKADAQLGNLAMGVDLTLGELQQVFAKHHIERIDPTGQPYDHNLHQAMSKIETTEHPEGTVVQVLQAAYRLHDRLLQPALVAVATAPSAGSATEEPGGHVDTQA